MIAKMAPIAETGLARSPDLPSHEPMPAGDAGAAGRAADVTARLRRRIATHALPPGARLREWEVASEFAVPRLTAREALDVLVHQGFAERQPNRGVVVKRRELAEVLQLFDLREVNEGLCARLAACNAAPESWDDLIELFGEPMAAIVARRDLDAYVQTYEMMRRRLIEAAAAPMLGELLTRLIDMTGIYGRRVLLLTDRTQRALVDHRAVLAALRRGDKMAAEAARRVTIANVRAAIEQYHAYVL
jgi:DNA-binding GntR family transcriptional regulator